MAIALGRWTGAARIVAGLAVGTHSPAGLTAPLVWLESSHPVPDTRSVAAGERALALARNVPADHLLLVILSGGASSLVAVPRPGITLQDKQATTRRLLLAGADIHALNTVRKHLSAIKGGQLAASAVAPTLAFAMSDVVGDDLSIIASGPTVPDPGTFAEALDVLARFGGVETYPRAAVTLLRRGASGVVPETPKPADPRLDNATTRVIGSRADAAAGAARAAEALGYRATVLPEPVVGEARVAGPRFVEESAHVADNASVDTCVIATGETTVRVTGSGRGGRNQELALSAIGALADLRRPAALLSCGTDGVDGPTDAAGAMADESTGRRSEEGGMDSVEAYLQDNDAYTYFQALGDLVITGPTDTNVGDIQVLLLSPGERRGERRPAVSASAVGSVG